MKHATTAALILLRLLWAGVSASGGTRIDCPKDFDDCDSGDKNCCLGGDLGNKPKYSFHQDEEPLVKGEFLCRSGFYFGLLHVNDKPRDARNSLQLLQAVGKGKCRVLWSTEELQEYDGFSAEYLAWIDGTLHLLDYENDGIDFFGCEGPQGKGTLKMANVRNNRPNTKVVKIVRARKATPDWSITRRGDEKKLSWKKCKDREV